MGVRLGRSGQKQVGKEDDERHRKLIPKVRDARSRDLRWVVLFCLFFWLYWVFAARGLSLLAVQRL